MAHGEKLKALWDGLRTSNRFWGIVICGAATGLLATPLAAGAPYLYSIGGSLLGVGMVNVEKRKVEEKKLVQDSSESK